MRRSAKIVFDVDNVLADSMSCFCKRASEILRSTVTKSDIKTHKVVGSVRLSPREIFRIQDDIWKHWEDIPSTERNLERSLESLQELGMSIVIATSGPKRREEFVREWLHLKRLPYHSFYPLGPKVLKDSVPGDALVDDAPEQIESFINKKRIGFLYEQPWNSDFGLPGVVRIPSIQAMVDRFRSGVQR